MSQKNHGVAIMKSEYLEAIDWESIAERVSQSFRFTADEEKRFNDNKVAQLIGATPFIAGCLDPLRTAISNLGTYVLSIRNKDLARPKPSDDQYILRRLELLNKFIGGDEAVIQRGMNVLALLMLNDYSRDVNEDAELGKYNPISGGAFDFEVEKARLTAEIDATPCEAMDEIMPLTNMAYKYDWSHFWLI